MILNVLTLGIYSIFFFTPFSFDLDKVAGNHIIVKNLSEGTKFTTLDGIERTLSADDLMICDEAGGACIAGVFGGLNSGVTEETKNVFLESAYFNPVSIRRSAKRHGLSTDASFRFERGIDPNIQVYALKRAAMLFKELAGGKISSEIIDINPTPAEDFVFELSLDRVNSLIGKEIPEATVRAILEALEVKIQKEEGRVLTVAVPPYRVDVQREADLVEDILRIYGYNNVEIPQAVHSTLSYAPRPDKNKLINIAADHLAATGYTEIMSNSLTKAAYYDGLTSYKAENCVKIMNPLSADLNVMRQTLLFNALEAVELNINHRNADLKLFELGNCYFFHPEVEAGENPLARYSESYRIAIAVTGQDATPSWNVKAAKASFYTLRAAVEKLLRRFGIDIYTLRCESSQSDLYSDGIIYTQGPKTVVEMGIVSPEVLRKFDIKQGVYFAEIDFDLIVRSAKKQKIAVQELSKFPEVKRDLALLVDKGVSFSELRNIAFATEKKLLKRVTLFDVYEGDKLPEGKKSYALGFTLEDKNQTLNEKTIEKTMANLQRQLETKAGAQVRS